MSTNYKLMTANSEKQFLELEDIEKSKHDKVNVSDCKVHMASQLHETFSPFLNKKRNDTRYKNIKSHVKQVKEISFSPFVAHRKHIE